MSLNKKASLLCLISLAAYLTLSFTLPFAGSTSVMLLMNAFLVSIPAFLIPSLIFRGKNGFERYRAPRFSLILLALVMGVGCIFLNISLGCLNSALLYGVEVNSAALDVQTSLAGTSLPLMVLTVAIIPAISEEFLMRGALLESWRRTSLVTAMLLTSLIFALLHTSPSNFIVYFAMGMLFGMVYNITRNVWLSITIHFMNNLISVLISALYLDEDAMEMLEQIGGSEETATRATYVSGFFSYLFLAAVLIVPLLFAMRAICRRRGIGMYAKASVPAEAPEYTAPTQPLYDSFTGRPLYEIYPDAPRYDAQTGEPLYANRPAARFDPQTGAPLAAPRFDAATGAPLGAERKAEEQPGDGIFANPFIWIALGLLVILNIFSGLVEFGVIKY